MVTIIIPTYNESENILHLIGVLKDVLAKARFDDYEILVMDDDSPDATAEVVTSLKDPRVRAVNRRGLPRGLSAAVIDGFKEAKGDTLGVMDADLSHPAEVVPRLVMAIQEGALLAVGSRYVPGGGITNWPFSRRLSSKVACLLARPLTPVKDATSGFFFLKKSILEGVSLNPLGFKIGLEVFVKSHHQNKIKEISYVFTDRREGKSKFGLFIIWCYIQQLFNLVKSGKT